MRILYSINKANYAYISSGDKGILVTQGASVKAPSSLGLKISLSEGSHGRFQGYIVSLSLCLSFISVNHSVCCIQKLVHLVLQFCRLGVLKKLIDKHIPIAVFKLILFFVLDNLNDKLNISNINKKSFESVSYLEFLSVN